LASPDTKGKGLRKSVGFYPFFIIVLSFFYPGQGQEGKEMISRSRTRGYKTDLKIQENSRDDKEKDIQVKDKRIKNYKKRIKQD